MKLFHVCLGCNSLFSAPRINARFCCNKRPAPPPGPLLRQTSRGLALDPLRLVELLPPSSQSAAQQLAPLLLRLPTFADPLVERPLALVEDVYRCAPELKSILDSKSFESPLFQPRYVFGHIFRFAQVGRRGPVLVEVHAVNEWLGSNHVGEPLPGAPVGSLWAPLAAIDSPALLSLVQDTPYFLSDVVLAEFEIKRKSAAQLAVERQITQSRSLNFKSWTMARLENEIALMKNASEVLAGSGTYLAKLKAERDIRKAAASVKTEVPVTPVKSPRLYSLGAEFAVDPVQMGVGFAIKRKMSDGSWQINPRTYPTARRASNAAVRLGYADWTIVQWAVNRRNLIQSLRTWGSAPFSIVSHEPVIECLTIEQAIQTSETLRRPHRIMKSPITHHLNSK